MKVRDFPSVVAQLRTRLLATRCRAPGEPDDSRIATLQVHGGPGILTAFDREFGPHCSYARRRPTRWRALRSDNRNPTRNCPTDVGGEICRQRNWGSVSVAEEYVRAQWPSCAAIERDPQRSILSNNVSSEKRFAPASHLNPLPACEERRTPAVRF